MSSSDDAAIQARDETQQNSMFLAFWLGGLVYGMYVILFVISVKIAVRTRKLHRRFSARVFTFATFVMFILTTFYMGISASRFLYAFSPRWTEVSTGKLPVYYLRDYSSFLSFAPSVLMGFLIWLGDALAIYRCLIIWEMNWWVVLLPCLLLFHSIINNSIILAWQRDPAIFTREQIRPLSNMVFPINITQSCLTTSLITFKIWHQHRLSRAAGLSAHGSGVNLMTIVRIIIESSMIFTVQQVILCVLYYMDNPATFVVHGTLVPSIGITFVLLSIRVNEARKADKPTTRLPQHANVRGPFSWSFSKDTSHSEASASNPRSGGRMHRRTVSESMAFAVSDLTRDERDCHMRGPPSDKAAVEEVDVEKGDMECGESALDAIFALNHRSTRLP